ncbi:MAG: ABC transporter ATP-binding protein [Candidatus Saccharimonadales bacterium]
MADEVAISVNHVGKTFRLPHERQSSIKSVLINSFRGGKRTFERQQVLKDITFNIKKGEFFGIVGRNGSGKSTLLKMLANIYTPTEGNIQVEGKLTPFIELGVGFSPELTGRENVFLNGALLGFNHKEMEAMYDDIVEFAEIDRFMDQKLKNYSSGMQVRLAFSIAIRAQSDILVLDEVLAVGDAIFQKKCYDYFKTLKKNKQTVVFVSHDTGALQEYCDKGIVVENGSIVYEGPIDRVVNTYLDILNETEERHDEQTARPETDSSKDDIKNRWGTGEIKINKVYVGKEGGDEARSFKDEDSQIVIRVQFEAVSSVERPVYGITITDVSGQIIFQSNTLWCEYKTKDIIPGEVVNIEWIIPNAFNTGTLHISPAAADSVGSVIYEWLENAATFKVRKRQKSHGHINTTHKLNVTYEHDN